MRVTRNYMSGLLGGNSNSVYGNTSLLQRALSRSTKSRRASRSALLSNTSTSRSNILAANAVKSTANTQKMYYNMKYHAGQVIDYADKLTDKGASSLFAKAKENGNNAEIVSTVKSFVSQYNSMMQNLQESGGRADSTYVTQLNSIARLNSSELASCGVSRNSDGTLAVDDKKLAETDIDTLEKVWSGNSSFPARAALWADSVESSAERNMNAQASNTYSNLFNNYGSSGNYFNFFR
ncbi:MAG: hypothetical protein K2J99_01260 [Lachnospiraceae bacterium]|nr:hypothetical protein [Lachnospiraceae bacterium]